MDGELDPRPLITAGLVLGIGLGGFVDGIVFHQILQTHAMLSAKVPRTTLVGVETNMVWDGLFHAVTWIAVAIGLRLLWTASRRADAAWSGPTLTGAMVAGWGAFNLVEGLIDHHLLGIHHVVEARGLSAWDWAFLGSGVALIAVGSLVIVRDRTGWLASRASAVAARGEPRRA
jgi:uncharacterized membrane protein